MVRRAVRVVGRTVTAPYDAMRVIGGALVETLGEAWAFYRHPQQVPLFYLRALATARGRVAAWVRRSTTRK